MQSPRGWHRREGTVLTMTCSTGLETSSPCIMAWRKERAAQKGATTPLGNASRPTVTEPQNQRGWTSETIGSNL